MWCCAPGDDEDTGAVPLMLGTNVWPGYETIYLARTLEGIDDRSIRLVEYPSASQVIRAFRNNTIQLAALTLDEVLLLRERGVDLRIVLVTDVSHGADAILARPDITNLASVKGRSVGVENTALGAYVLSRALQTIGLSTSDVKIVPLEVDEHEQAFKSGVVDAIVTFEPVRSRLLAAGAHEIFDSSRIPDEIVDVVVIRNDVLNAHRDEVKAMLKGYFEAHRYLHEQPDAASELMVDRMKLEPAEILKLFDGLRLPDLEENISMLDGQQASVQETAKRLAELMKAMNLLRDDVDLTNICDADILNSLRKE